MARRASLVATLVAGLALSVAGPTAAGDQFGSPSTVITSPEASSTFRIGDLAAAGETVIAAVVRESYTGDEVTSRFSFYSLSEDGGDTFDPEDVDDFQALRVDVCPTGVMVLAVTTLVGGDRRIIATNGLEDTEFGVDGADSSRPDVACVPGKRVAVAYLRTQGGTTTARLRTFQLGTPSITLVTDVSLGAANKGSTPAVAAVGDRIHVAWTSGTQLRFKRFLVGGAPGFALTAKPTVTLESTTSQGSPRLAADGGRVVLAWERKGDVVARVSTDKGVAFGARRTLFDGQPSSGKVALLTNADVAGSTLIVSGTVVSEGISVRGSIKRSTNNGAAWSKLAGSERTSGFVSGALSGSGPGTVTHLVVDSGLQPTEDATVTHQRTP